MRYLKVQQDTCPKCNQEREIIVYGNCNRKGTVEYPEGVVAHKCLNCGDYKKAYYKNNQ